MVAVTASPAAAVPATRSGRSRCTTMCSPTRGPTSTSALAVDERAVAIPATTASQRGRARDDMTRTLHPIAARTCPVLCVRTLDAGGSRRETRACAYAFAGPGGGGVGHRHEPRERG